MARIRTRVEPIARDVELIISQELSPPAQSRRFAELAGQEIEAIRASNRRVLGRLPRETITVDGREGASLASVKPNGVIIAEWDLFVDVLVWIGDQLVRNSPVRTGKYAASHVLYADGVRVDVGDKIPDSTEFTFANEQPYARKIERGQSSDAPDGVYQAVAVLAARRFGNIAKVRFTYVSVHGKVRSARQPAITLSVRSS